MSDKHKREWLWHLACALCLTPKDDDFWEVNEAFITASSKCGLTAEEETSLLNEADKQLRLEGLLPT